MHAYMHCAGRKHMQMNWFVHGQCRQWRRSPLRWVPSGSTHDFVAARARPLHTAHGVGAGPGWTSGWHCPAAVVPAHNCAGGPGSACRRAAVTPHTATERLSGAWRRVAARARGTRAALSMVHPGGPPDACARPRVRLCRSLTKACTLGWGEC